MKEYEYEKRIMGTEAAISVIARSRSIADATAAVLFEIAEAEEERFSRFRPSSELSRLNSERAGTVSRDFMDVLLLARELHRSTKGAFNPLVDISRFGYDADITEVRGVNRTGSVHAAPYDIDMETVAIDATNMRVALQQGQNLDLGGLVKGYAAEKMAKAARDCQGVLVNLGGDIYVQGLDAEGNPFEFSIDDPTGAAASPTFTGTNLGIATSGTYNRNWTHNGESFFHILNREGTGNPTSRLVSVTVLAKSGAQAEAMATALFVLGMEEGVSLLKANQLEYCFIREDGAVASSKNFPFTRSITKPVYA
jgi:thiamine biosynthesis lipoprotein